jgi:glycosyltransferase involved in cell wall biosynthesis
MRVFFLDHACHVISGAEFRLLDLARSLPSYGITPIIACDPDSPLAERVRTLGVELRPIVFPNLHSNRTTGRLAGNIRGLLQTVLGLRRAIERSGADVVHVNTLWPRLPGLLAARLTRRPTLWHVRDFVIQPAWRRLYQTMARLVDRVVTVSDACRAEFPGHPRMATIYNGLDLKRYQGDRMASRRWLGVDDSTVVIAMSGMLTPWKGHEVALEALARMGTVYPGPARLVMAGLASGEDQAYRSILARRAADLGIAHRVQITGFCEDMPRLLAAADVSVAPSVRPDPLPGSVLEAMAMECPVVASRIGGIPEIVQDNRTGFLVGPGDASAMAERLVRLAGDPGLRERMGRAGRLVVERRFDLDQAVARLVGVYAGL